MRQQKGVGGGMSSCPLGQVDFVEVVTFDSGFESWAAAGARCSGQAEVKFWTPDGACTSQL